MKARVIAVVVGIAIAVVVAVVFAVVADVVWPYSEEGELSEFSKIFEEMKIYQLFQYLKNCKLT